MLSLLTFGWLILALIFISYIDTGKGLFLQIRIGQFGKSFTIYKIRSMHFYPARISNYGNFLRKYKLDELPQLFNVLIGNMSFVGPRPDVPGYYDLLQGENRKLLDLKPGIFSRAALKYYNEETILAKQHDPQNYNDKVIFPDKVRMNLEYYYKRSFVEDLFVLGAFLGVKGEG